MTRPDPYPDPLEKKRLEKEAEEALPNPLPGFGLGSSRLKGHGLGVDRLERHGLGAEHQQDTDGRGGLETRHQTGRGYRRQGKPQRAAGAPPPMVAPNALIEHQRSEQPRAAEQPRYVAPESSDQPLTRRQFLGLLAAAAVLVAGATLLLRQRGQEQGQYGQLGEKLGQGESRGFEYVGDSRRQLYWPNEARYVEQIAPDDRVYFRDQAALDKHPTFSRGPL